jgi:hypothetical protein
MLFAIIMVLDLIELNSNTSNEIRIELKLLNSIQIQSKKHGMKISEKDIKNLFINIMLKKKTSKKHFLISLYLKMG